MTYDFSKVVKVGSKLLVTTKNGINGLVVPKDNSDPPVPENSLRFMFSQAATVPTGITDKGA